MEKLRHAAVLFDIDGADRVIPIAAHDLLLGEGELVEAFGLLPGLGDVNDPTAGDVDLDIEIGFCHFHCVPSRPVVCVVLFFMFQL